jgi:hypothetical protein
VAQRAAQLGKKNRITMNLCSAAGHSCHETTQHMRRNEMSFKIGKKNFPCTYNEIVAEKGVFMFSFMQLLEKKSV